MAKKLNNSEMIAKASRGYIKDYYQTSEGDADDVLRPSVEFNQILDLFQDSTFQSEVYGMTDSILNKGFKIYKEDKPFERDLQKERKFKKKYRSEDFLRSLYLNIISYRNFFGEVEYQFDEKKRFPKQIHVLETTEMNVRISPHGEYMGAVQIHTSGPTNPFTGKRDEKDSVVKFSNEEAIHLAANKITTNPYGYVDTAAIARIIKAKRRVEDYFDFLFIENKFRDVWFVKQASGKEQVKSFIEALKQGKVFPSKDIVVEGDIEQKQLRNMEDFPQLLALQDEYKDQIREWIREPGRFKTDSTANKSGAEIQTRFNMPESVRAWQKIVEPFITYELFPLLGWDGYVFQHFYLDRLDEEKYFNMAMQMKGLEYDSEYIHEYLISRGMEMPEKPKFKEPEEEGIEGSDSNSIAAQSLQNKNAPSRKDRSGSVQDANASEDVETREEQRIGKASKIKFGQYPYIF